MRITPVARAGFVVERDESIRKQYSVSRTPVCLPGPLTKVKVGFELKFGEKVKSLTFSMWVFVRCAGYPNGYPEGFKAEEIK